MRVGAEILENAVDMHVHADPDFHPRLASELEILQDAKKYGMRAILSKSHYCPNADRARVVSDLVEGIECFGGIVLNPPAGGFNPSAVESAIRYGGKEVWMPTFYTKVHLEKYTRIKPAIDASSEGISILREGKLLPELHEILDLIARAGVILGTAHCHKEEIRVLLKEAISHGVKKILITHPYSLVPDLTLKQQEEFVEMGAFLELCLYTAMPVSGKVSIAEFVQTIRAVGPEKTVLATDFGQPFHPFPAEGMRIFCQNLLAAGIEKEEIDVMIKENTAYLLDL